MSTKLKVAMLGPSGVGKTALLTVMSRELGETTNLTDLRLKTDEESEAILQKHYQSLEELVKDFGSSGSAGISSTQEPRDFLFTFDRKNWLGRRQSLELEFLDIPGGYLSAKTTPEKKAYYVDSVANSGATIIVIDTIALMQNNGRFNEQRNQVRDVTELMKTAYKNLSAPKLVIFVPIKCETYLQEGREPKDIVKSLKRAYDELLRFLLPNSREVAIAIAPVKTVGCVIYGGWGTAPSGELEWYLRKTREDAPMKPEYADIPLRYLLRFLISQRLTAQRGGFLNGFNDLLGRNEDLKEAIKKFANVPKMGLPVEILQGDHLINVKN